MLGILGSFAEFERAIIRERQAEGIALTPEGVEGPVGGAEPVNPKSPSPRTSVSAAPPFTVH